MDQVPKELIEAVADLHLPQATDQRLQSLMDRNTRGSLTESEKEELGSLAEWSETVSLIRARALRLLGRSAP